MSALKDFELYFKDEFQVLKLYQNEINVVLRDAYYYFYEPLMGSIDANFFNYVLSDLVLKDLSLTLKSKMPDYDKITDRAKNKFQNYTSKYPEMLVLADLLLTDIYCNDITGIYGIYGYEDIKPELINELMDEVRPIMITKLHPNIKLFHGTNMKCYKEIMKTGYIIPTDYTNANFEHVNMNKLWIAYSNNQSGFVFASSSLDVPIEYACGAKRGNAIGFDEHGEIVINKDDFIEQRLHSDGAIFIIHPEKYNVYYAPRQSEFLIDSKVDINDTDVIFVKRDKGYVRLVDEKGNQINDLRYE